MELHTENENTHKPIYLVNIDKRSARIACHLGNQSVGRHHRVNHVRIETDREGRVERRRRQHIDLAAAAPTRNMNRRKCASECQKYESWIRR